MVFESAYGRSVPEQVTDRAAQRATSRALVVAAPFAGLAAELGVSMAVEQLVAPWGVAGGAALAASSGCLVWLAAKTGRDRTPVGKIMRTATGVGVSAHLLAAAQFGALSGGVIQTWAWIGGTVATGWAIRLWVALGGKVDDGGGHWWDQITAEANGLRESRVVRRPKVTGAQVKAEVALKPGLTVEQAQHDRAHLASRLGLPPGGVRIVPNRDDASRAEVTLVRKDVLREPVTYQGPSAVGGDAAAPYRLGVYDDGEPVLLRLHFPEWGEAHLLIQGMTGSGKTAAAYMIFAEEFTRLDTFTIYVDTVKGPQSVGPLARGLRMVIDNEDDARLLMKAIRDEVIPYRVGYLGRRGLSAWKSGCGIPRLVVHVEEGSGLFLGDQAFVRVMERARSAGVQIRLSGQRFSFENIPTSARAQFASALCLGVEKTNDARFVLTDEIIEAGADPSQWKNESPGCAFLVGRGIDSERQTKPLRMEQVDKDELALLGDYAALHGAELDEGTAAAFGELWANRRTGVEMLEGPRTTRAPSRAEDDEMDALMREAEPESLRWKPPGPEPEPDVHVSRDEELPSVAGFEDMPLRGRPKPEMSPEEAKAVFEKALTALVESGAEAVTGAALSEVSVSTGRSRSWVHKQLHAKVEAGVLRHEGGRFVVVRELTTTA